MNKWKINKRKKSWKINHYEKNMNQTKYYNKKIEVLSLKKMRKTKIYCMTLL
jgi:hypothetical protein